MSHRKRAHANWQRELRRRRAAEMLAAVNAFFKRAFPAAFPRRFIYRDATLLAAIKPERER